MEAQPGPARKRKDRDAAPTGPSSPAAGDSNRLLAGYLAHEFLTRGTVLGERLGTGPDTGSGAGQGQGRAVQYEAVAVLVQGGGARVPGVVNPAQLAAWARRKVAPVYQVAVDLDGSRPELGLRISSVQLHKQEATVEIRDFMATDSFGF